MTIADHGPNLCVCLRSPSADLSLVEVSCKLCQCSVFDLPTTDSAFSPIRNDAVQDLQRLEVPDCFFIIPVDA